MKILKFITAIVLVVSIMMTAAMPISAARVTYYLSDLQMAEADTAEEAKKLLTEAGYTVLDRNLNPGGGKAVYLGYKKTTNVDDAITDIRVMNMDGGFNITDYETIKKDAVQEYKKTIDNFRIAAKEFAENYQIGKKEALLAYRQLNYYYVENNNKVKTKMGDYMLNFPEKNDDFADILFKGNPNILNNIRILLAMGVSDGGTLIDRIKAAVKNEDVYTKEQYFEDAKELVSKTQQLKKLLAETKTDIEDINADPNMTKEEKELALILPCYTSTLLTAFDEILKDIPMGESNYSEYFDKKAITDYSVLYPFIEAMTPGQRAMAVSGQLHAVLVYNAVEMSDEELETKLNKIEEKYEPMSVSFGTDTDLLEGAVGITSDALREEAATGKQWFACFTGNMAADITISALFGAGGAALLGVSGHYLLNALDIGDDIMIGGGATSALDKGFILDVELVEYSDKLASATQGGASGDIVHIDFNSYLNKANATSTSASSSAGSIVGPLFATLGMAIGFAMIVFSITSIVRIVNKYNTEYTAIPANMVDTVETVNGNRYVNYKVVNSFYKDGSKTATKPGDTNGYGGDQWNAIYYTKNYEAGKCMTASGYFVNSANDFGKYTPVAMFGSNVCYNLNSYNGNENSESIFMAFGNSNNKKTAATAIPTVVGSVFAYGGMAISGVVGLGIGIGLMSFIKRKKEKTVKETQE